MGHTTHTSSCAEKRLKKAYVDVLDVLKRAASYGHFDVVYEKPPMHWRKGPKQNPRNTATATYMIGQAVATIRCACIVANIALPSAVEVKTWRSDARKLGMIRKEPKEDAVRWMQTHFQMNVSHDAAEACMIAFIVSLRPSIAGGSKTP